MYLGDQDDQTAMLSLCGRGKGLMRLEAAIAVG